MRYLRQQDIGDRKLLHTSAAFARNHPGKIISLVW
jgi:hypothetical protein